MELFTVPVPKRNETKSKEKKKRVQGTNIVYFIIKSNGILFHINWSNSIGQWKYTKQIGANKNKRWTYHVDIGHSVDSLDGQHGLLSQFQPHSIQYPKNRYHDEDANDFVFLD